jgi:2-polyprenyl-3-methyl-5-hydroxy-6-metoxy-1,4-benzoquinol methylase
MVGFDDLYRQGGAVTWQAGKEDVVRQVVELVMGLTPTARVLDFGCGTGWTAPILTASGARYLGIDPSAEGIAQAEKRWSGLSKAHFHRIEMGQSLTDALHGAKFTHVFALDALYFAPNLEGTLEALCDALEPDGMLCTIAHLYRESRVADSLIDDVRGSTATRNSSRGCSGSSCWLRPASAT